MKEFLKLIGIIFLILGGAASLFDIVGAFFPGSVSIIVSTLKKFIANNWLTLIIIGLLIAILVILIKEHNGAESPNE